MQTLLEKNIKLIETIKQLNKPKLKIKNAKVVLQNKSANSDEIHEIPVSAIDSNSISTASNAALAASVEPNDSLITVTVANEEHANLNNNNDNFTTVKSKKKNKKKRNMTLSVGSCNDNSTSTDNIDEVSSFCGRGITDKKVWLFISLVNDSANEEIIKNYIKKKTSLDCKNIIVTQIQTLYDRVNSKCFKIGVSFEEKEKIYSPNFWPTGVAFRRFKFINNTNNSPGNFLGLNSKENQSKMS